MEQIHGGNIYELKRQGREVIDFSANINPLGMPKEIKEAVSLALENSERYPDIKSGELLRKLSMYEALDEENIVIGNGAADIIYALCLSMKFKRALIMEPTFSEYQKALNASGTEIIKIPLTKESGFDFISSHLELIDEGIDALFLCQPNNPTGLLIDEVMLSKIVAKCRENHVFIVIDECFLEFLDDPSPYSLKKYINGEDVFILKSFTKLYAMAGLRLGYGMCKNKSVIEKVNSCRQPWSVSNLAEAAGIEALDQKEFVAKSLAYINKEKDYLINSLKSLNLKVYGSSANYIFFYSKEHMLYEKLLKEGILIRSCESYKTIPEGFFRIAVRTHEENERLIKAIKNILKG